MTSTLLYHEDVLAKDIPALSSTIRDRIKTAIERKLIEHPETFGKPLRRSLRGYLKLRIGDYRVIFRIEENTVKIFAIGHRSVIYGREYAHRLMT